MSPNNAHALSLPDKKSWVFTLKKDRIFKMMPKEKPLPGTTNKGQILDFHPGILA